MHAAYGATGLPIVGMGGVETGAHALELIAAGASGVALGTVLFADPGAPERERAELAAEAARRGLDDALAARGLAHGAPGAAAGAAVADAGDASRKGTGRVGLKV